MAKKYEDAGVSIKAGDETVDKIKNYAKSTFNKSVLTDIGLFGAFFQPDFSGYKEPVLVSSVDGVGTKLKIAVDMDKWSQYIQWLTKNRHESVSVIKEVNKMLKNKTTGVFDAAKYLKHKVQSYEVGFLLDTEQKQIKEYIKENIIKSIISYAGSKGMIIFNDTKATAFMVSSTYLKCGG